MKNFKKVFELIKKTGDKFIVETVDGELVAIMDVSQYEDLIFGNSEVRGLSKPELINKINKDISVWKSENHDIFSENIFPDFEEEDLIDEADDLNSLDTVEEDKYYFEPEEDAF